MQRQIVLMRHGHAAQAADDYERPLSDIGQAQARGAGAELRSAGWIPARVLSSSAPRALSTARAVAAACGYSGPIREEPALYLAAEGRIVSLLRALEPEIVSVLVVGHNPGLSALARALCKHERELAPAEFVSVTLELEAWADLD